MNAETGLERVQDKDYVLELLIDCIESDILRSEDREVIENIVFSAEPRWIYAFMQRYAGTDYIDLDRVLDVLINTQDAYYINAAASTIPGINVKACENALIEINDLPTLVEFMSDVPGADVERIYRHVIAQPHVNTDVLAEMSHAMLDEKKIKLLDQAYWNSFDERVCALLDEQNTYFHRASLTTTASARA